jgi:hypothetical protein
MLKIDKLLHVSIIGKSLIFSNPIIDGKNKIINKINMKKLFILA